MAVKMQPGDAVTLHDCVEAWPSAPRGEPALPGSGAMLASPRHAGSAPSSPPWGIATVEPTESARSSDSRLDGGS